MVKPRSTESRTLVRSPVKTGKNRGGRKKGPKTEIGESFKNKEVKDGWGNIEEKVPTFPPGKKLASPLVFMHILPTPNVLPGVLRRGNDLGCWIFQEQS